MAVLHEITVQLRPGADCDNSPFTGPVQPWRATDMAKRVFTVDSILSVLNTGLDHEDGEAFRGYLAAELGAFKAKLAEGDVFGGLVLKGKGDKAKGKFDGGGVEFTGGHNVATLCIHFACLTVKQADILGIIPLTIDVRPLCEAWLAKRKHKTANVPA